MLPPKSRVSKWQFTGSSWEAWQWGLVFKLSSAELPVSWMQRYSFKCECWIRNINMQLYEICIQMNYADQLKEAPRLWNRKTSKAILIKLNQSYSIYINIHTLFFSLALSWFGKKSDFLIVKNQSQETHCTFHFKLRIAEWKPKHFHLSKDRPHWNHWNYCCVFIYIATAILA